MRGSGVFYRRNGGRSAALRIEKQNAANNALSACYAALARHNVSYAALPEPSFGTAAMDENPDWKPWEGVHAVPGLKLDICPWCKRQRTDYFVVVYERAGEVEAEPVCNTCSAAGTHFIAMRKDGLSRKLALEDFGFRSHNGRKPEAGAA